MMMLNSKLGEFTGSDIVKIEGRDFKLFTGLIIKSVGSKINFITRFNFNSITRSNITVTGSDINFIVRSDVDFVQNDIIKMVHF